MTGMKKRPVRWLAVWLLGVATPCALVHGADDKRAAASSGWREMLGKLIEKSPPADFGSSATEAAIAEWGASDEPQEQIDRQQIKVNDTGALEIHVRDAEIDSVLELLSYETRTNIVATPSVKGQISANLFSVKLADALDAILTPNNFGYRRAGNTIFVGTAEEIAAQLPPPETRVFRLKYLTKVEASAAIKGVLSAKGKVSGGDAEGAASTPGASGSSGAVNGGGSASIDFLMVSDTADRLDRVTKLLEEIDVRPRQVLIEATILRATLNESNQFGIDFTMLGGIDFQNVSSTSNASADLTTGQLQPGDLQQTTFNANTNLIGTIPGGFTFGLVKDSIAGFIKALESVTDVSVIANPKVLALNRQDAQVIVGRRDGYLTSTTTETSTVQTVEFLETGTQIRIKPIINENGTVRLIVHPKDSNGGLTAANLPFEETTEAQADILINDGHTVLIGGLFRERTVGSREQVPLVGNIPVIGLLFQRQSNDTIREEVIILLTVNVLKDTREEQTRSERLLDDIERVRVGSRKGLLGTGRERLAQAYYQEALRRYETGELDKALLNVRMALHNQPRHLSALKLKEELLGKRMWDSTGGRSRAFLHDMIRDAKPPLPKGKRPEVFGHPPMDMELERDPTPRAAPEEEETP